MSRPKQDNLYQRNGVWWIRYNAGGRKIRRSLGTKNHREAKRLRDQILAKRTAAAKFGVEAAPVEPCKTFGEIAELWLASRAADESLAPRSLIRYRSIVRGSLVPEFGHLLMSEISTEQIERFIGKLRRRLRRPTVAGNFVCLQAIIRRAIRRGWYIGANPLDRLDSVPTQGPGRDVALTEDEAERILAHLSGPIYYRSALAMHTGLRWGEVYGLGWADLSLDTDPPLLTVSRSFHGPPKNEASAATIPVSASVVTLLRRWRGEGIGNPWLFPTSHGAPYRQASKNDAIAIRAATLAAGIDKPITPHVFRHSFGTWIYERTGDPKTVQRLMRHASFTTSMGYVHDRRDLASVVNKLPSLIASAHLRLV